MGNVRLERLGRRLAIKRMLLMTGGLATGAQLVAMRTVAAQTDLLSPSGAGVNVKEMPSPDGQAMVPLRESFGFDAHYAQCIIEDNPAAFAMETFGMGQVVVQAHSFFMAMYSNELRVVGISRTDTGALEATLAGQLSCHTFASTATVDVGSRWRASRRFSRSWRGMEGRLEAKAETASPSACSSRLTSPPSITRSSAQTRRSRGPWSQERSLSRRPSRRAPSSVRPAVHLNLPQMRGGGVPVERAAETPGIRVAALRDSRASPVLLTFVVLLAVQGLHLVEHITQVIQRYFLGIPNGNGILGSVADIEPVHFLYNAGYLGLLVATWFMLGLNRGGARRVGRTAFALLTFALIFQGFHVAEHVFKMIQYFQLGHQNGTGGIFGIGPGGIAPVFAIPLLHLVYNAIGYLPAVLAFLVLVRRGHFRQSGFELGR